MRSKFRIRKIMLFSAVIAVAIATMAVLSACGSSDEKSTAAPATSEKKKEKTKQVTGPTAVKVALGEWYVKAGEKQVKAGEVKFNVKNDGKVEHEFLVVKTDHAASKLPMSKDGHADLEKSGKMVVGEAHGMGEDDHSEKEEADEHMDGDKSGEMSSESKKESAEEEGEEEEHLKSGASSTYSAHLKPGKYVLLCNIPGHYKSGQNASLTVV